MRGLRGREHPGRPAGDGAPGESGEGKAGSRCLIGKRLKPEEQEAPLKESSVCSNRAAFSWRIVYESINLNTTYLYS